MTYYDGRDLGDEDERPRRAPPPVVPPAVGATPRERSRTELLAADAGRRRARVAADAMRVTWAAIQADWAGARPRSVPCRP